MTPQEVITHIADVARDVGWQAGIDAMETAGSFVSFLAANPHLIAALATPAAGEPV